MKFRFVSLSILSLVFLCSCFSASAQVRCKWKSAGGEKYQLQLDFTEVVTGLQKRDFATDYSVIEELIPIDGTTRASKSFIVRLSPRGRASENQMRVALPANRVQARGTLRKNSACGPVTVSSSDRKRAPTATPTPTDTPVDTSTPVVVDTSTPEPTATATSTETPEPTATTVPTTTNTPVLSATLAPTMTSTPRPTSTSTVRPTSTATPRPTSTATPRPTSTATTRPTASSTPAATATPAATSTPYSSGSCSDVADTGVAPVLAFPGAVGHGRYTVGGSGRHLRVPCTTIYRVTNLRDSGTGSLRQCVEAKGPRTCVFDVGGEIWAAKELRVMNPYLTIAGQTAPAPGINIRGSGISVEASDVIVRHVRMRIGDDPRADCCKTNTCSASDALFCTTDPGSRDGMRIRASVATVRNVIIDHCSISWALDEGFSMVPDLGDIENVTFSNNIIGSGLDMSIHPEASIVTDPGHSKAVLINGAKTVKNLSFVNNYLAHNADRNIRAATPLTMEYINNLIYDWGRGRGAGRTIELTNKTSAIHSLDVIGNLYLPGPDTFCPTTQYRPELCFENGQDGIDTDAERAKMHYELRVGSGVSSGLTAQSRYYLSDNRTTTRTSDTQEDWAAADRTFFDSTGKLLFSNNKASAPVASSGSMVPLKPSQLMDAIVPHVGATPRQRDIVDNRLIDDVLGGTGRIINCVADNGTDRCKKNAGGWPSYTPSSRSFGIPANALADMNSNGYTDLEDVLNFTAGQLE